MLTPEQIAACGSESAHQKALFAWIALQPKDSPLRLAFAIPNGGKRDKITAARMKAEGVRAGVPDIFLPVARGGHHGLFIEMKVGDGRTSTAQDRVIEGLRVAGYCVVVCWSWEAARNAMRAYVGIGGKNVYGD